MRTSVLLALLVVVMMVSFSDGWGRFRVRFRARRFARRIKSYVRRHSREIKTGLAIYRAFGKRSAGSGPPPCLPPVFLDPKAAQDLLDNHHLDCPSLSVTPQTGVNTHALLSAFSAVDDNGDESLDKEELLDLGSVLGAFDHCLDEQPVEQPVEEQPVDEQPVEQPVVKVQ